MEKRDNYRYTEDGVLLVKKYEASKTGVIGFLMEDRERWYRCSEKDPDRQYLQTVLGGWFGFHKFMEGSWVQGLGYLLTCGCFGVFYLYDLLSLYCGNYFYRKVTYVNDGQGIERRMQKIYYGPLEHKKRAALWFVLAVVILVLTVCLVYQPIGKGLAVWLAAIASGQVTEEIAGQLQQLIR